MATNRIVADSSGVDPVDQEIIVGVPKGFGAHAAVQRTAVENREAVEQQLAHEPRLGVALEHVRHSYQLGDTTVDESLGLRPAKDSPTPPSLDMVVSDLAARFTRNCVALHVNLDKMPEPEGETFTA